MADQGKLQTDEDDRPLPLPVGPELDQIADVLAQALEVLGAHDAAMPLIAAGLDLVLSTRCGACRREALLEVRSAIDNLLAEGTN
jgi:hypothetical protein